MSFVGEGSLATSLPLAEMGIEIVWERALGHLPKFILAIAVLASGLVGKARLRPDECIYYNSLIGNVFDGPLGADRYGQSWDDPGDAAPLHLSGQVSLSILPRFRRSEERGSALEIRRWAGPAKVSKTRKVVRLLAIRRVTLLIGAGGAALAGEKTWARPSR